MIPAHAGPTARTVASGVLVAVAVAASMLALTSIVVPGGWTRAGLVGIVMVSVTTVGSRVVIERRARARGLRARASGSAWPSVLGGVVAAWLVLARFGGPTADPTVFVTPEHVARVVARLGEAGEIARSEVAPVAGSVPMGLLAVGGTLLVLLLADALAGALRRPAAVGLPLLALWCPPLVLTGRVPWGVFVVTVTALLLLLTLDGPLVARSRRQERTPAPVRRAERSRAVATTAAAAVLAIVAGLVGSASAALPGGPTGWYRAFTTTGDTIRLAEDLDILRSLTERSSSVVLSYDTGSESDAGPLRSYTATAFDGRRWQRGEERGGREFAAGEVLWPDDPPAGEAAPRAISIAVGELRDDKLPLTIDPREVEAGDAGGGQWGYDPARDEVVGGLTDAGDSYTLTVHERDLDPAVLRDAPAADLDAVYTQVPDTVHAGDVEEAAREVVGPAETTYDQAVALQRWLRDPTRFTYSTTIPRGGTGDPVWDFLQHRTGYCIQFATTMVVMARSIGIPARLAVGYLPGDRTGETTWEVTGQDSHAWPEVYFPGAGWVRFEPTPAQQTGSAPAYTMPRVQGDPAAVPTANDLRDRRPTAASTPTEDASPTASSVVAATSVVDTGLPAWAWITSGTLLVALAGGLVLLARRRRAAQELDPEIAWQQVLTRLASGGVQLPPATTLRRAPGAIASAVTSRSGRELPPEVLEDLAALADATESGRYAREPRRPEPEELERLTGSVTAGLDEGLGTR
ncbi:transglutaminaseTgpA domain-containing protein [Isoptericola sp. 4D.3]|uniref:TransglutaminaseTgpA domain-containing protein n=1 Tax=Isoptericola peretonis TaxID=2918523 RepID=A0ABT0J7T5_9MICO|nr:transglutaminaseTgpA domain-containing protein [Isoptericola sp. 4D.3]